MISNSISFAHHPDNFKTKKLVIFSKFEIAKMTREGEERNQKERHRCCRCGIAGITRGTRALRSDSNAYAGVCKNCNTGYNPDSPVRKQRHKKPEYNGCGKEMERDINSPHELWVT